MNIREKIKWKNHNFYYTYDINEDIFSEDYFQFFNGNAKKELDTSIKLQVSIQILSSNELMINGPFFDGYYVVINNQRFDYSEYKEKPDEVVEHIPLVPPLPQNEYSIEEDEYGNLYMNKLKEDYYLNTLEIKVKIEEYTNEVYPDYPFKTYYKTISLNKFHNSEIIQPKKNVIYIISLVVNGQKYSKEYRAPFICYFSNVKDLKVFIKDLNLEIPEKSNAELRKLIQEKSVQLKRKFGLSQKFIEDPEYFPIYKKVVNLYCVENLISVSFINGNFISSGINGSGNGLTLSKFKINDEGGNSDVVLSTNLIKDMIKNAEADLYSSIFKKPVNISGGIYKLCWPQKNTN